MWKKFVAKMLVFAFCVSALAMQEEQALTVYAGSVEVVRNKMPTSGFETEESKSWFASLVDAFKNDLKKESLYWAGVTAGGVASSINGGKVIDGILYGSILGLDANYYNQPTKIFDTVASAYKTDVASSSTSAPGYYYYQGSTTNNTSSTTNSYHVYQDMSNYTTNTYNYQWYNPITNNYNYTNNYSYNYEYNTYYYQQTINNYQYDYYYIDNSTHITYYIVQTDTNTNTQEDYIYDMYYELPDGRNSYTLREEDVWGSYFLYNTSRYSLVAEDDGKTLGLWHFDGDLEDSSYWKNSVGACTNLQYSDGFFGTGKYFPESSISLSLPLDGCSFDPGSPFTLEWRENLLSFPKDYSYNFGDYGLDYSFKNYIQISDNTVVSSGYSLGEFVHYALVYDGSEYTFFKNGVKQSFYSNYKFDFSCSDPAGFRINSDSITIYSGYYVLWEDEYTYTRYVYRSVTRMNSIIDELRLSKGVLYTDNFAPPAQPFDTNKVLALPEDVADNTILFYTGYDYGTYRMGGVRPTYPSDGDIYVYMEGDVVQSTQQYQTDKWVEIESFLYQDGQLVSLAGYSLTDYKVAAPEDPDPDDGSGDDSSGDGDGDSSGDGDDSSGDDDGGGFSWSSLIEGITKLFGSIIGLVGKLVGAFADLVNGLFDALSIFTDFSDGYSSFLAAAFPFIPPEVWNLIKAGILAMIIVGVIKLIRG